MGLRQQQLAVADGFSLWTGWDGGFGGRLELSRRALGTGLRMRPRGGHQAARQKNGNRSYQHGGLLGSEATAPRPGLHLHRRSRCQPVRQAHRSNMFAPFIDSPTGMSVIAAGLFSPLRPAVSSPTRGVRQQNRLRRFTFTPAPRICGHGRPGLTRLAFSSGNNECREFRRAFQVKAHVARLLKRPLGCPAVLSCLGER